MNIQYQRSLKNSYMVVVEPGQPLNLDGQLAEKMMQRQQIPGLLHWVTMEHEGDMTFWYQITGLQSLSDWLQHHPLDHKLFGHLLSGLLALQEDLPRFYLKTEHLLLQEEQIFLDTSGEKVAFCYEPMWQKELRKSLQELMEHLLPRIDHNDRHAVRLGYGLYEKCQEANADVWQYVLEQATVNRCEDQPSPGETLPHDAARQNEPQKEVRQQEMGEEPETSVGSVPGEKSKHASGSKQAVLPKEMFEKLQVSSALEWIRSIGKKKKEEHSMPVYLFEPEEVPVACEHPTVYLGAGTKTEGRLLYQGTCGESDFVIEGDSFLIGGRNDQADGQLQASGISRNHARITKKEDVYYIEDLNSRNGTYLNGSLLSYKQKYRIKPGDHLRFAREEYMFC